MPSVEGGISEATQEWVESVVGPFQVQFRFAHDHGYSALWKIATATESLWLKCHTYPAKWAGEVHALTQWAPELGRTPRALAWRADLPAVILSDCPGEPAESVSLALPKEMRLWTEAGDWLRRLHQIENDWLGGVNVDGSPHGTPSHDPVAFARSTFDRRIREGNEMGLFSSEDLQFIDWGVAEWLPSLEDEQARAIHRDYSPRNWLTDTEGRLTAVIDFEHARWDVRAADLNRWWDHEFVREPRLKEAFCEGYGEFSDRLLLQIAALRLLQAAGSVVWGTKVGELAFAERNRIALERMRRENNR